MKSIDFWKQEEGRCDFDDEIDEEASPHSPGLRVALSHPSCVRNQSKLHSEEKLAILTKRATWKGQDKLVDLLKKTKNTSYKSFSCSPIQESYKCTKFTPKLSQDIDDESVTVEVRHQTPVKAFKPGIHITSPSVQENHSCMNLNKPKQKIQNSFKEFCMKHNDTLCKTVKVEKATEGKKLMTKNNQVNNLKKSGNSIKELLGTLVKRRRMSSMAESDMKMIPKRYLSEVQHLPRKPRKLREEQDDYCFNPFKSGLTPVKLRDRSATFKDEQYVLVTMNDIGAN
ncbi:unnamed protein product [Moneuplotes crassus]|uniref:Uncharacterized protein n=1 Tax=Euplotes crassus TaxID=5936 RepID=A0AAD2D5T5_EUPCR|nr:unnamed protein product [Moneuplotes crassus]